MNSCARRGGVADDDRAKFCITLRSACGTGCVLLQRRLLDARRAHEGGTSVGPHGPPRGSRGIEARLADKHSVSSKSVNTRWRGPFGWAARHPGVLGLDLRNDRTRLLACQLVPALGMILAQLHVDGVTPSGVNFTLLEEEFEVVLTPLVALAHVLGVLRRHQLHVQPVANLGEDGHMMIISKGTRIAGLPDCGPRRKPGEGEGEDEDEGEGE